MKYVKILGIFVFSLFVFVGVVSVFSYLFSPDSYRFGSEVGGLLYKSGKHYIALNLVVALMSFFAMISLLRNLFKLSFLLLVISVLLFFV